MSTPYATAPAAPSALGSDADPRDLLRYLDALITWRDRRRTELDELDRAALDLTDPAERAAVTPDVTLSMTLWQAVSERLDLLTATWDSGRVGEAERTRMTTLVWGSLEPAGAGGGSSLAVNLPEATRLSDSLAASLRSRLRLDGADPDLAGRLRSLRQQVERIADQVALIPESRRGSAAEMHAQLDERLVDITERARRGADVGGLLAPLEQQAALAERDLIVAASTRATTKADVAQATREVAELAARGHAVRQLAQRTRAEVTPAPTLGIPDVTALGEVPTEPQALAAFRDRLQRVSRALGMAQSAYAAALTSRDELTARATRLREAVAGTEAADDLAPLAAQTEALLARTPLDLTRLEALVQAQETFARTMGVLR